MKGQVVILGLENHILYVNTLHEKRASSSGTTRLQSIHEEPAGQAENEPSMPRNSKNITKPSQTPPSMFSSNTGQANWQHRAESHRLHRDPLATATRSEHLQATQQGPPCHQTGPGGALHQPTIPTPPCSLQVLLTALIGAKKI